MRIIYSLLLFLLLIPTENFAQFGSATAQNSYTQFHGGAYWLNVVNKKEASTNFGAILGRRIDNHLFFGVEFNYYRTIFRQTTEIADSVSGNIVFQERQRELDFKTQIYSFLIHLSYDTQLDNTQAVFFRASAAAGFDYMRNSEFNFIENIQRTRSITGSPSFLISAGLGIKISDRGRLIGDVLYKHAVLTESGGTTEQGLPTFTEFDLSGLGVRVGISIWDIGIF